jgi:hypothetical protein
MLFITTIIQNTIREEIKADTKGKVKIRTGKYYYTIINQRDVCGTLQFSYRIRLSGCTPTQTVDPTTSLLHLVQSSKLYYGQRPFTSVLSHLQN